MRKTTLILFIALLINSQVHAKWIWTAEEGWINTEYSSRGTAKKLLENGKKLQEEKRYLEARESFLTAWKYYPDSPEGKEAILIVADSEMESKQYYIAYVHYESLLEKNPSIEGLQEILKKQYTIGAEIIRGKSDTPKSKGVTILEGVIGRSPYSDFADDAQITIANYYYKEKMLEEAKDAYESFLKKYPKSEWYPSAKYSLALCSLKQYRGIEHEATPLQEAKKQVEQYIEDYPDSKIADEAKKTNKKINEDLATKKIATAEFYIQREKFHSAKIYLKHVIKKYPDTRGAQKAKLLLKQIPK